MLELRLYMAQRITALIMAPLIIGHIALMIYAVQGGISVEEILGRTQGSVVWFLYYSVFVIAVSIHAAIGVRTVLHEWGGVKGSLLSIATLVIGISLFWLGARAVWAVTFA